MALDASRDAPLYFKEGVTVHWDCTKAGQQDVGHPPDFLLTHSSSRPDKGEERTGSEYRKKKREQHGGSLLVLELLAFFSAVAFSQAHIIQCNLPSVTTPFFTFEDDLGKECIHWSSLLCPFPIPAHLAK